MCIADEIVVDVMAKACGVDHADAAREACAMVFGGVPIPVASPQTLLRAKDTVRPADAADRQLLQALIDEAGRCRAQGALTRR